MLFYDVREGEVIIFELKDNKHDQWFVIEIEESLKQSEDTDLFEFAEIYRDIVFVARTKSGVDVIFENKDKFKILIKSEDEVEIIYEQGENKKKLRQCRFNNFNYISRSIDARLNQQEKNLDDVSNKIIQIFEAQSTMNSQAVDVPDWNEN